MNRHGWTKQERKSSKCVPEHTAPDPPWRLKSEQLQAEVAPDSFEQHRTPLGNPFSQHTHDICHQILAPLCGNFALRHCVQLACSQLAQSLLSPEACLQWMCHTKHPTQSRTSVGEPFSPLSAKRTPASAACTRARRENLLARILRVRELVAQFAASQLSCASFDCVCASSRAAPSTVTAPHRVTHSLGASAAISCHALCFGH